MSSQRYLMQDLTWPEFQARLRGEIIMLPTGSLEQHGPHLPLGVDVVIPTGFALRTAEALGAGIVAPAVPYGYKSQPTSGGGPLFPGRRAWTASRWCWRSATSCATWPSKARPGSWSSTAIMRTRRS